MSVKEVPRTKLERNERKKECSHMCFLCISMFSDSVSVSASTGVLPCTYPPTLSSLKTGLEWLIKPPKHTLWHQLQNQEDNGGKVIGRVLIWIECHHSFLAENLVAADDDVSDVMEWNSLFFLPPRMFSPSCLFCLKGELKFYAPLLLSSHSSPPPFSTPRAHTPSVSAHRVISIVLTLSSGTW